MIKEGPMKDHINNSKEGVVKAEYITYTKRDGYLMKETTVRKFLGKDGNYIDSYVTEPITEVKDD
tara:strand:- start:213 stop:407 length:195 start_codon:yes stop_codon:yes gene_type:complete